MFHSLPETSAAPEHLSSPQRDSHASKDMNRLLLPLTFLSSSIFAVTSCIRVDGYSCVSAYWDTVTCVLNFTGNSPDQSTYSLKFNGTESDTQISCPLVKITPLNSYTCTCKISANPPPIFLDYFAYDIELCHESICYFVAKDFFPSENIQPTPPHEAEVLKTREAFNITWKSGYEDHRYLTGNLDYEILLQTSPSEESKTLQSSSHEKSIQIQRSQLKPGATYCIKVRSIPGPSDYKGTWSKWSPSTCWKNEAREGNQHYYSPEQDGTSVIFGKSLGLVFVAVGVLLFVFYSTIPRMRIKTLFHTPSPAPFFRPLFQQHEGNLKEWLSPQGRIMLMNKPEEILTTDAVIVTPKPILKEPEENRDLASVAHLEFTQCQTAYVGLPGIHEASPPVPVVCSGNTSYTQLPCSVWGVGFEKTDIPSQPEDFLNISHTDSGCSCADLTQSLECRSTESC